MTPEGWLSYESVWTPTPSGSLVRATMLAVDFVGVVYAIFLKYPWNDKPLTSASLWQP